VIVLTIRHARYERASARSKRTVTAITTASVVIYLVLPDWVLFAVLLQVAVGVYIILHQTAADEHAKAERP
jgi:uncharacterized membrane protein YccC